MGLFSLFLNIYLNLLPIVHQRESQIFLQIYTKKEMFTMEFFALGTTFWQFL